MELWGLRGESGSGVAGSDTRGFSHDPGKGLTLAAGAGLAPRPQRPSLTPFPASQSGCLHLTPFREWSIFVSVNFPSQGDVFWGNLGSCIDYALCRRKSYAFFK